ncbi:MAG: hypothetical protein A2143_06105 [Gallionellales bacterium RBG_16_57_15]|nr:MAG: hypothetical protein A2143_06105 [Gallionellales bacterium RBG_16_57_15]
MLCAGWAWADSLPPTSAVTQSEKVDFNPPPVPGFMLRQPDVPLTLDEMRKQADEAARRAQPKAVKGVQPLSSKRTKAGE